MRTFLIGFMGAGKTTLGKQLAAQSGHTFLDLDDLIEEREGKQVQEIFAESGEAIFRQKEREALSATSELRGDYLIACGGGTPCFGDNMQLINQLGTSVYLRTSPEELTKRLLPYKSHRPLISYLSDKELLAFIQQLLQQREVFYLQAHHILESDNPSLESLHAILDGEF